MSFKITSSRFFGDHNLEKKIFFFENLRFEGRVIRDRRIGIYIQRFWIDREKKRRTNVSQGRVDHEIIAYAVLLIFDRQDWWCRDSLALFAFAVFFFIRIIKNYFKLMRWTWCAIKKQIFSSRVRCKNNELFSFIREFPPARERESEQVFSNANLNSPERIFSLVTVFYRSTALQSYRFY